ncbi:GNAT family N-acetyltransferase [Actinorhabdospora filicis]|uniref:GNAT family N-acetyltransferase n=1 Tax=Actinorhabdospora filicis TaxID=1785913 RepID=UPI00255250AD|nr:GNAT family N-acetyltransferase [Actinorhabdospora filicis]
MTPQLSSPQLLARRLWSADAHWHPGDFAWQAATGGPATEHVWPDAAWARLMGEHLDVLIDPSRIDPAEVIAWAPGATSATVNGTEDAVARALVEAGFERDDDANWFSHHHIALDSLPSVDLAPGYRLRAVTRDEAEARAEVHRRSWSDLGPSTFSVEKMTAVMSESLYDPAFDIVAETDDGEMVATTLGWLDRETGVGLLEPVGCVPEHRRKGLGRATNLAVLQAFRDAGATLGRVCPRGDEGYPIPGRLYRSIGFKPVARTELYRRV